MAKFGWKLKRLFSKNCSQIVLQTNGRNAARVENEESRLVCLRFSVQSSLGKERFALKNLYRPGPYTLVVPARSIFPCCTGQAHIPCCTVSVLLLPHFCRAGILFLMDKARCFLGKLIFFFLKSVPTLWMFWWPNLSEGLNFEFDLDPWLEIFDKGIKCFPQTQFFNIFAT